MKIRVLSRKEIAAALDMPTAIAAMREAFRSLSDGTAHAPTRLSMDTPGGVALFMPGRVGNERVAAKLVSVNLDNPERYGLPAIHAAIAVFDPRTGALKALLEGEWLTALRTGAGGGLAADLMACPQAGTVALFGAGVQARTQLDAVRCVREVREVRVFTLDDTGRTLAREIEASDSGLEARAARTPEEALAGADLVIAATTSPTPVFDGSLVEDGAHVTGIGSFTPEMAEVDATLVARARIVVDQRAGAMAEAGDILQPLAAGVIDESAVVGELGDVVAGRVPGRTRPDEITFFKSVGNAVQDVAVAHLALVQAEEAGLGTVLSL
ncbi:MAG: ornithine cyclodeaminase family protein [Gemmatimonadetes bacterium]|nr:ornithine cyclodeaminase family protein [Gemmatimonadota bacterium]